MSTETDEILLEEEETPGSNLVQQAVWIMIHSFLALFTWVAMMALITMLKTDYIPVVVTLALSFVVPFVVGNIFTRIKQNDMAPYTWLIGLIWFLIVCLWILDMPTGPNQCYHCDASQKMYLTFFSPTEDSGLIDGQGRLIGTWPTAALIGYGLGSRFALKKRKK
jgi:hypothetical protein